MDLPLVAIAKQSIKERLLNQKLLDLTSLRTSYPPLNQPGATFVTLNLDGELRGCIGTLEARRALLDDLVANAKAAAFEDPRFYPLSQDEFEKVEIEVSLLTPSEPIDYKDIADLKSKITPYEDGIILELGYKKATFLPQVWEQLPSFEQFFSHLCQKAGLGSECLEKHPLIRRYRVYKYHQ